MDCDLIRGTVSIIGAKHTIGGIGKLRTRALNKLTTYIRRKKLNANDRLFPTDSENISEAYRRLRNKVAKDTNDPIMKQIRLYDFRHFKASIEYHLTNSMAHVQDLLGHKDIRTTRLYAQLSEQLNDDPEWIVESTQDQKRADELLRDSFDYVLTTPDGYMKFRKRK